MRTYSKKTGSLIRKRRIELGMRQEALTKALGWKHVSTQQLSNIELGKNPVPSKHINKLSLVLKLNRSVMLDTIIEDFKDCLELEVNKP
jgi:transcriptional regulator with XRE-family HTH domain